MVGLSGSELLAVMDAALDALDDGRLASESDADLLSLLVAGLRVGARMHAWQATLTARLEAREVASREHGTSTTTWLADRATLTSREAGRLLAQGRQLERFRHVGDAALAGTVSPTQADAITGVLDKLPTEFSTEAVDRAQGLMVGFAATHNSTELRRLSRHLLEVVAPDLCDQLEAERLEREYAQAQRERHLTFKPDHHGSVLITGSLPICEAEPFIRIVDAYAAHIQRTDQEHRLHAPGETGAELVTPAMRRADGLIAMIADHQRRELAPGHGGDRPRVVVTLAYDQLLRMAIKAGFSAGKRSGDEDLTVPHPNLGGSLAGHLVGSGEPIPAGVLRRWLCEADLLPVVLGGASEVLDVGRSERLATPAIRTALEVRDQGCVFPGCEKPPQACQAHHITPWWAGGSTSLVNMVLACPQHHGIVEPGHDPTADRWQVRLRPDQVPEVIPPRRVDPHQRPRLHARFLTALRR